MLTFGELFAGIGGFSLGFERAGMKLKWQVECDPFAKRVLEYHWPRVRRWGKVETFPPHAHDEWRTDVICAGFPCQPVSNAGEQLAQFDERWLWPETNRVLRCLRPRFAVLENVTGILSRGFDEVLSDLAALGFDAEWGVLSASAFGAAHPRERVFVFAYPAGERLEGRITAEAIGEVATPALDHLHDWPQLSEPLGLRSVDGFPNFVDRITCLGNAVSPIVTEWIGRRIIEADSATPHPKGNA